MSYFYRVCCCLFAVLCLVANQFPAQAGIVGEISYSSAKLNVKSRPGRGTTFEILLPVAADQPENP